MESLRDNRFYIKLGFFLLLLAWFAFLMTSRIDLATADLGRHIKNGEVVVHDGLKLGDPHSVLKSNFYSYTYPDYPFVNHHWAAGMLFYFIWAVGGFKGLSLAYILMSVFVFLIFFLLAWRESNFTYAALFSFFLIPLMAERREIRPEGLSVLFAGLFFFLLWRWNKKEISPRWLLLLPVLMILWVNLHIYFFLGLFLLGVFFLSEIVRIIFARLDDHEFDESIQKIKWLVGVGILTTLATLLNPSGWKGAIHPLTVYKNYGYTVLEEKSVWFLENYGILNPNFLSIKAVIILLVVGFFLLLLVNRKKFSLAYLLMAIFFGVVGFMALRNFSLLGFFALPLLAWAFFGVFSQRKGEVNMAKESGAGALFFALVVLGIYINWQFVSAHGGNFGIGLAPGVQKASEFFKEEKISGPIFNNYDIGGYLVWNLFPQEKVFVDNRPEVYPDSFFSDVYKPMQQDPAYFEKVDSQFNFNAIFFYRHDITPWAQAFFTSIQDNENWTKVFEDDYAIIYLKNNEKNQDIIKKYQLPDTKY